MPRQILHEAEHTRQHSRYKIPAKIEVNGKTHQLDNWSVSGLAIEDIDDSHNKSFEAKLIFSFGTFDTSLDVNLERKSYNDSQKIMGCNFSDLRKDKLAFMHYIINAYIAGELVTGGSLIEVLKNDRFTTKDMSKVLNPDMTTTQKLLFRARQILTYLFLTSIVLGLVSFISFSIYNKLFIVESLSASVEAPVVIIRSPQPSYYSAKKEILNSKVKKEDLIATMKLIGGGVNSIESPTKGKVIMEHALNRSFVDKGEPLLTIIPSEALVYIEAKVSVLQSSKLVIGQNAKVKLSNGEVILAKVKQIKSAGASSNLYINPLQVQPTTTFDYIRVILEPVLKIDVKRLGEVASVKIDTLF